MLPAAHAAEFCLAEQTSVGRPAVDVQRDYVDRFEELFQRRTAFCVTEGQLVGTVVKPDRHAERFSQDRKLRPDIAVPDNAKAPASDLVAPFCRFVPHPFVHFAGLVGKAALQGDYLGYDELDDAARVGKGSVEHAHPMSSGRPQVYLVGPDAEGAHGEQVRGGLESTGRNLSVAPHAEDVHVRETRHQFVFGQCPVRRLDLVTRLGEDGSGVGVDVLQEKDANVLRSGTLEGHQNSLRPQIRAFDRELRKIDRHAERSPALGNDDSPAAERRRHQEANKYRGAVGVG